jgi:hypothetical protein
MYITATHIADWARTKDAQTSLSRLVRRLCHAAGGVTHVAFPSGDSSSMSGWDGELESQQGNAWIPRGTSYWELSCHARITEKASADYRKRTRKTRRARRSRAALVMVSARRWTTRQKDRWLRDKRKARMWADVRVYGADDLEQWLEQSPAVALQFADELGLTGPGVESPSKHWKGWSEQSDPPISTAALFIDRQKVRERFIAELRRGLQDGRAEPYAIRADSVEEGVAFICAALLEHPHLNALSVVVTEANGWRFVEQNPGVKIAIAARPEAAENPTRRNGLVVIIPYAVGDMAAHYRSAASGERSTDLRLERPRISEFEKALVAMGLNEGEAKRLSARTGRSWSVFRRRRAVNPAIRKAKWLDSQQARVLSTVCLLGGWSADKVADRGIISRLAGRSYEDVERDLRDLAGMDDAPVLEIGSVWKAKAPLELLDLFGSRITRDELDRSFEIARQVLSTPDPQLELPDEQRYAAQIYDKIRPESDILITALCDTLVKLAVRGSETAALSATNVEDRITGLVRDLLHGADGTRWLSLSSLLPSLAEAAPEAFLLAVETSLSRPDAPVTQLLTETRESGLMGRCWHAGLLWALEILAWAPDRLTRVSLILARLAHVEIKGNWGALPKATLGSIFRSWLPKTAANLSERIAVIDTLIRKEPTIAFDVLDQLVHAGPDTAWPTARPAWRDDDAGAGYGVSPSERQGMVTAAADRLITCSEGYPAGIARLIEKIDIFDRPRVQATLALADQFTRPSTADDDREIIRTALRERIYWHRNYGRVRGAALSNKLRASEDLCHRLSPRDSVVRHRWLFATDWPHLPGPAREDDYKKFAEVLDAARTGGLREIRAEHGMAGIERLAADCSSMPFVGIALAKLESVTAELAVWIVERGRDFTAQDPLTMTVRGLLRALAPGASAELVTAVLDHGKQRSWGPAHIARFLVLARDERATWNVVAANGTDVENAYWSITGPGYWSQFEDADFTFVLHRLLKARRPRTALAMCHLDLKRVDPEALAQVLESLLRGEEPDGPLSNPWRIGEAIERLEKSAFDRGRLARLEFGFMPALGYGKERRAASLYQALMSDPELFTEVLCLCFKPSTAEEGEPLSEATKAAAAAAWRVLDGCRRQPGVRPDGTVDPEAFVGFIDRARDLCRRADRLDVCDSTLGQILAHAPADADGVWPFGPARDVLERPESERMRHGFQIGVRNRRGMTSRALDEGGQQERKLAEAYRSHACTVRNSHPIVAAALEQIARSYERDARREDVEAELLRESY